MKAIEWIQVFKEDGLKLGLQRFIKETGQLILTRKAKSPSAIDGVIREQRQKFTAIARRMELDPLIFDDAMEVYMPEHYRVSCEVVVTLAAKRLRAAAHERSKKRRAEIMLESDPDIRLGMLIASIFESIDTHREINEMLGL